MNRFEDKHDLIRLTDLAIDWQQESRHGTGRPVRRGFLSRLWASLGAGRVVSDEAGEPGDRETETTLGAEGTIDRTTSSSSTPSGASAPDLPAAE